MADPSYNYSYTPTVDHRESNLYIEEYYSSTDTQIYMNDEKQTEIGFIQYEIQEQLKPVYGYNSRTFDDVVIGNRIVTGSFTVPIKNIQKQQFSSQSDNIYSGSSIINNTFDAQAYNLNEENNLYNTDWFGSTARNIDRNYNAMIDTDTLVKLIALGYDVTTNASTLQYQKAIKQFQKDHNLAITGNVNTVTSNKIDEAFSQQSATSIILDGATGYADFAMSRGRKPLSGDGIILETIPTSGGDIFLVMDSHGEKFYIRGITV